MSNVAIRSAGGTKSGEPSFVTRSRKPTIACFVGPSFHEISARYKGTSGSDVVLLEKLRRGGGGAWGQVPMPPNPDLAEADARALVQWILGGAK